ncbi:hypothetical protein CGMCC3_g9864 [Colletotrichum fructicola]|nr:uncharacterized protein CGMCC3_g9864 [Colletotrichum fructicola]KAE9574182.1 hypothetical protein CGMCC3_g9864 [Colletotrichum fructicola]KAF4430852.1 EST/SMG-like protein 1 [Colletotrichum fructicola]
MCVSDSNSVMEHGSHGDYECQPQQMSEVGLDDTTDINPLVRQPNGRVITEESVRYEVRGIYAGLVDIEAKAMQIARAQKRVVTKLKDDECKAVFDLYETLLDHYYDFFVASQHFPGGPAVRRLPEKYDMVSRMCRHGIRDCLEILHRNLPESKEHMLSFISVAFSTMMDLYETTPGYDYAWAECIGDIAAQRATIEGDSVLEREFWVSNAAVWYAEASDKDPGNGRLYHHLALVPFSHGLQQLFYHAKALCAPASFSQAEDSMVAYLKSAVKDPGPQLSTIDLMFMRTELAFLLRQDDFTALVDEFVRNLKDDLRHIARLWMAQGTFIHVGIIINCSVLFEHGSTSNTIIQAFDENQSHNTKASLEFVNVIEFACRTHAVIFEHFGEANASVYNLIPYVHTALFFLKGCTNYPTVMEQIEERFPWHLVSLCLNTLLPERNMDLEDLRSDKFPRSKRHSEWRNFQEGDNIAQWLKIRPQDVRQQDAAWRPLPEDFAQRGLLWGDEYPSDWFTISKVECREQSSELGWMAQERIDRCLWLGFRLSCLGNPLVWLKDEQCFGVTQLIQT